MSNPEEIPQNETSSQLVEQYFEQFIAEQIESGRITVIDDANLLGES